MIEPGNAVLMSAGILVTLALPLTQHFPSITNRRDYYRMQLVTAVAALFGAKVAVLIGDGGWPLRDFHDWEMLLVSGRSILGALLFGFLIVEAVKPVVGYKLPPNDRFAINLAIGICIGRIGCLIAGCCHGVMYEGPLAVKGLDGIMRFPSQSVEIFFHFVMAVVMYALWRRRLMFGRMFAVYLTAYGVFRFVSEFWRDTPKWFDGFSGYQWLALVAITAGSLALYLRRSKNQPEEWNQWKPIHDHGA